VGGVVAAACPDDEPYRLAATPEHLLNRRTTMRLAAVVLALGLLAAACGSSSDESTADAGDSGFVFQGEQVIDGAITTTVPPAPDDGVAGAGEGGSAPTFDQTDDTVPTNDEDDADGEFFDAVGGFMSCLTTEGYAFLGVPDGEDETAPVNDPGYIEALRGCAAATQIVDKMQAAEDTSNLSTEEIEESNRQFTLFVDCLKGKGWEIPPLSPDENGVLQTPYIEIARSWTTPDGSSLLDDDSLNTGDFAACGFTQDSLG